MHPSMSSISNRVGTAVISLLFSFTATWPSTKRLSLAQAETKCSARCPVAVSKEWRKVLPTQKVPHRYDLPVG